MVQALEVIAYCNKGVPENLRPPIYLRLKPSRKVRLNVQTNEGGFYEIPILPSERLWKPEGDKILLYKVIGLLGNATVESYNVIPPTATKLFVHSSAQGIDGNYHYETNQHHPLSRL